MKRSGGPWYQNHAVGLGLLAATLASIMLWYAFRSSRDTAVDSTRLLKSLNDDDEAEELEAVGKNKSRSVASKKLDDDNVAVSPPSKSSSRTAGSGGRGVQDDKTPLVSNVSGADRPSTAAAAAATPRTSEKDLHHRIEEIDRRGKALFKAKKYMEAAEVFTEALDLIETSTASGTSSSSSSSSNNKEETSSSSLKRQIITLTNNRSAMYEKANLPDLALHDCDAILSRDPNHSKARTRRLRILESLSRYREALVEVCALQLKFMQENRDKLRLGIPVTPPVPQNKIEEFMEHIIPQEVEVQMAKINARNERRLPSSHTIVQLLKSFSGYNSWMSAAARDGSVDALTSQLNAASATATTTGTTTTPEEKAKRATLLLKRGRRYAYDRQFDQMKDDIDEAYKLVTNDEDGELVQVLLDEDTHARILEWEGMARHLRYDLAGALKCYEKCGDLEPTNAEILVKRAGVKMDAGKHEEAMTLFDTALGLDPDAVDALLHRANLRMLLQKPAEAKADLERCLKLRPDHLLARLRLATVLMATDDLDAAKRCLDKAEAIEPQSSEVHSYRGEMHFAQGQFAEARAEFDRAIECDEANPNPYVNAALAIMNTPSLTGGPPDVAEAIRLLEKAVEVDPQFHAAYVHLGQLKLSMATDLSAAREVIGLYDRGLEYCRTAEELKDICSMRILTIAQVEAASVLKMETLNMQ